MGVVSLLEAIMGTSVDLKGLEAGIEKGERIAEEGAKKIQSHFDLMAVGIATAITGAVLVALEKAIHTTAEWGLEMEHLSNRMGVTVREAATLVGVMERFGVNANIGARAMQMLSQQVTSTQNSLDPFATRLGKTLGSLRDTSGAALNMAQVLDLVRQKVAAASTDSEKLQIATSILGARIGGQLVPMLKLSNEEWERQKKSVDGLLGPVEESAKQALEYKKSITELEQSFRHMEVEVGTRLLPLIIKLTDGFSAAIQGAKSVLGSGSIYGAIGAFSLAYASVRSTREETSKLTEDQDKLADASARVAQEIELTEQNERKVVALVRERVALEEKALALGMDANISSAVSEGLEKLDEQRRKLASELTQGLTPDQRLRIETEISKNRIEAVELVRRADAAIYKREEEAIKHSVDLRLIGIDTEIAYRKQKAAEMIGRGDIFGAAGEIVKARDLAIKQADQVMEFTKKIRVVSLQSEIDYQKEKLALAKGNAEEEMKILSQIADLDKQLYDQRLQFSLRYTQNTINAYRAMQKATGQLPSDISGAGESSTFAQAGRDAERAQYQQARNLRDIAAHGGTEEARSLAIQQAQAIYQEIEGRQRTGERISDGLREVGGAARELLKAASGGEEVRAPGGPSPTIGSLLSPSEGLATAGLARGSDIPRLDTSYVDMSIRIRDVLLGTIPNIQNFSNAVQAAATRIASLTGTPLNPGIVGPGGGTTISPTQGSGQLATSGQTTAPATVAPGNAPISPTPSTGIGSVGGFGDSPLARKFDDLIAVMQGFKESFAGSQDQAAANAQSLLDALQQVTSQRVKVDVGIDPGTGDVIVTRIAQEISQ